MELTADQMQITIESEITPCEPFVIRQPDITLNEDSKINVGLLPFIIVLTYPDDAFMKSYERQIVTPGKHDE